MSEIRVLVVDDSPSVTRLLAAIFAAEPGISVVGTARDGREAVAMTESLKPDLVTMDIQMPVMDGVRATAEIMERRPTPIVVITGATRYDDLRAGLRAIEAGALVVIDKPKGLQHAGFDAIRRQLVNTVRAMSELKVVRRAAARATPAPRPPRPASPGLATAVPIPDVVGIGASTGGPHALRDVLSVLPADFPAPIVVVQHLSLGFMAGLVRWLGEHSRLAVTVAGDGEVLAPGRVYFAPDERHLHVHRRGRRLLARLAADPPVEGFRPAATPLLESIATACPGRAVGVVLTGMGRDGAQGLLAMRAAGCHTIAQDRQTSVVFGMPGAAIELGAAERVLALGRIGSALVPRAGPRPRPLDMTEVSLESPGR